MGRIVALLRLGVPDGEAAAYFAKARLPEVYAARSLRTALGDFERFSVY